MIIIVDNRLREEEKKYLESFGKVIIVPTQDTVYSEISSHPDIFISKIGNKIICAPCIYNYLKEHGVECTKGEKDPSLKYPNDILYNVCQVGNYVIGNFEYTDKVVLEEINNQNLTMINVKQGYSNCSCTVINEDTLITSDEGIFNTLVKYNLNVLLVSSKNIRLFEKEKQFSKMQGFIGGATCVIQNVFIIFGDLENIDNSNKLLEFLSNKNIKIVDFKGLNIIDYGGIIFT